MKNIQIIDGAQNASFSIFQATDEEFAAIFPAPGQDIEIAEDLFARLGENARVVVEPMWERPIHRRDAQGIHGALYYDYADRREHLPASKREIDRDPRSINWAQRQLYKRLRNTP
ncbi:MAG: hypothetical protein ABIO39_11865 [Caulobacteraceae bacterium]